MPHLKKSMNSVIDRTKDRWVSFRLKATKELFRPANRSAPFANLNAHRMWRKAKYIIGERILKSSPKGEGFPPERYIKG